MKKNLIYTVAFLLCGAFFFSSCQDMLNVDSDRVEYDYEGWSANDSVYSALGILKAVQGVADRQILLNELRADLISISDKAIVDVQDIANFNYKNSETNQYLDVKDYYTIINNCNIYLSRVDTTIKKGADDLMMPEYVAVKSMRAWTYLQLAINYNEIPFFTEPITKHSVSQDVMERQKLSRREVIDRLIADIALYENPAAYPMPTWYDNGKILTFGYNNTQVATKQLFVPIRMLLGELYLWNGDYKNAAKCFYDQIAGSGTNNTVPKYTDNGNVIKYSSDRGKRVNNGYSSLFAAKEYSKNEGKIFTLIPFASSDLLGTTSTLSSIFSPENSKGGAQVVASQGMLSLSRQQKYRYIEGDNPDKPTKVEYSDYYEYPGDLRIKATTYSQIGDDEENTEYNNIIAKFNLENGDLGNVLDEPTHTPGIATTYIMLQRAELAYLRLAEALVGMAREGYHGALDLAMIVLKEGPKQKYPLYKNPVYSERPAVDKDGKNIYIDKFDAAGNKIGTEQKMEKYISSAPDLELDFTHETFDVNIGIHSRGTGDAEHNEYYDLDSMCIARYNGWVEKILDTEYIKPGVAFTKDDSLTYVADLVIDELALELSWEGTRFGDLIRFSEALNDNNVLAKRVAGRAKANTVKYRDGLYEYDSDLYNKLFAGEGWYLPLPDEAVEPAK